MKRTVCLLSGLSVLTMTAHAGDTRAGELTDPIEILKKVDAAAKAVKAVKYDVVVEATGSAQTRAGKIEATIIAVGYVQMSPEKYLIEATVTQAGSTETKKVTAGTDGDTYFVVDHQNKKAYEDIDPAVMGRLGEGLKAGIMIEFVHPTPFSDEIKGRKQELKGSKTIGGEDCFEIHVFYNDQRSSEAVWCFSKKDFLPRRRYDPFTLPDGSRAGQTRTITNLVVDPKLGPGTFKLKLPEGYTKTDDFAP